MRHVRRLRCVQYGWTALMSACRAGHRDMAELLLDRDAEVDAADKVGRCAACLLL